MSLSSPAPDPGTSSPAELGLRMAELPTRTRTKAEKLAAFIREEFRALNIPVGDAARDADVLKKLARDPSISDERLEALEWATASLAEMLQGRGSNAASPEHMHACLSELLELAQRIDIGDAHDRAVQGVALALAEAGNARLGIEAARGISDEDFLLRTLADIAAAQAAAGDVPGALDTARGIASRRHRVYALKLIAIDEVQRGRDSLEIFRAAVTAACEIVASDEKDWTLRDLATAEADAGYIAAARSTAELVRDTGRQATALAGIARAQGKVGDRASALETLRRVPGGLEHVRVLRDIALAESKAGKDASEMFLRAYAAAHELDNARSLKLAVGDVAVAQAEAGNVPSALHAVRRVTVMPELDDSYLEISVAQARSSDARGALETARLIQNEETRIAALFRILQDPLHEDVPLVLQEILACVRTMRRTAKNDYLLSEVAAAHIARGELAAAHAVVRDIADAETRTRMLSKIAVAEAACGACPVQSFHDARVAAHEARDTTTHMRSLRWIAAAYAITGKPDTALVIAREAEGDIRDAIFSEIAIIEAQMGNVSSALQIVREIGSDTERAEAIVTVSHDLVQQLRDPNS